MFTLCTPLDEVSYAETINGKLITGSINISQKYEYI